MSTERIRQLHEQATEHYLTGDYAGALECWRDVLGLDPKDEQALSGLRMVSQYVESDPKVPPPSAASVEHELDRGLSVLDSLGGSTRAPHEPAVRTTDQTYAAEQVPELSQQDFLSGWDLPPDLPADLPADLPSEDASFGFGPFTVPPPPGSTGMSAAAAELGRRVSDLLGEANAKFEAGERDEALSILARLAILDEDNAQAAALRAKIESASTSELDKVENALIEGVAALESDNLDDAERYFREALALSPEHREARHYLEKVAERRERRDDELLNLVRHEAPPPENAIPLPPSIEAPPPTTTPKKVEKPPAPAPRPKAPRATLPPPKVLIWAGVGIVVLAGVAIALPRIVGRVSPQAAASNPAPPQPRAKRQPKAAAPAKPEPNASERAIPSNPDEAAKLLAEELAKGRELAASGDFGGAVIAFNNALRIDSTNAAARAGLEDAGERYKAVKAEKETLNQISLAFRDGEYSSGLRMAYRLPPTISKSYTDAVKVAGWYDMAIVALRAGECRDAISHLDEALGIAPDDADAKKLKEFASRYVDAVKDRTFLSQVEALTFRPLPAS